MHATVRRGSWSLVSQSQNNFVWFFQVPMYVSSHSTSSLQCSTHDPCRYNSQNPTSQCFTILIRHSCHDTILIYYFSCFFLSTCPHDYLLKVPHSPHSSSISAGDNHDLAHSAVVTALAVSLSAEPAQAADVDSAVDATVQTVQVCPRSITNTGTSNSTSNIPLVFEKYLCVALSVGWSCWLWFSRRDPKRVMIRADSQLPVTCDRVATSKGIDAYLAFENANLFQETQICSNFWIQTPHASLSDCRQLSGMFTSVRDIFVMHPRYVPVQPWLNNLSYSRQNSR